MAGTLCVADPTNGASLQSLGPVATVLENVDQTYQIWTDGADFFDAGDSGPGECGGPNGVPSGAVWTLSDPINGIVIACTPADSPFFGEVARLASAV